MLKNVFKITGIILLIGFISVFVKGVRYQTEKSDRKNDIVIQTPTENKQDLIDEDMITSLLGDSQEVIEKEEEKVIPEEVKSEEIVHPKKEVSTQPKQEVVKVEKDVIENNTPPTSTITPNTEVKTETTKQEIWDILGMTEDQYYNKPMYSWERVDFNTYEECNAYGESYAPAENGEVLYNCREITSMSGKYLGIMFDTEKLR